MTSDIEEGKTMDRNFATDPSPRILASEQRREFRRLLARSIPPVTPAELERLERDLGSRRRKP